MKETKLEASELKRLYDGLPLKVKEHNINFDLSRIIEVDLFRIIEVDNIILFVVLVFFFCYLLSVLLSISLSLTFSTQIYFCVQQQHIT